MFANIYKPEWVYSLLPFSFGKYVCQNANNEPYQKAEGFHNEAVRLLTFQEMPSPVPIPATRLARAGFYYPGEGTGVICFRCGGRLTKLADGDDPAEQHRCYFPDCPLMRGTDTENVPNAPTDDTAFNGNKEANGDPFTKLENTGSTPSNHSGNVSSLLFSLFRSLGIGSGDASGESSNEYTFALSTHEDLEFKDWEFVDWEPPGFSSPEVATPHATPLGSTTMAPSGDLSGERSNENMIAPSPDEEWEFLDCNLDDEQMQGNLSNCPCNIKQGGESIPNEVPGTNLAVPETQSHAVPGNTTGPEGVHSDTQHIAAHEVPSSSPQSDQNNTFTVHDKAGFFVSQREVYLYYPANKPLGLVSQRRFLHDIVLHFFSNQSQDRNIFHSLNAKLVSCSGGKDDGAMCNPERMSIRVLPLNLEQYFLRQANGPPFQGGEEYRFEAVRLLTFQNMPLSVPVSVFRLARTGFYYSGEGDEVICFSCGGRLREWARGDDPAVRHRNFYPDCRLMRGSDTENVPILPSNDAVSNGNLTANDGTFLNLANTMSTPLEIFRALGISLRDVNSLQTTPLENNRMTQAGVTGGEHPRENTSTYYPVNTNRNTSVPSNASHRPFCVPSRMRNESDRLATFVSWPCGLSVRPRDLARAGFFYVGTEDRVQCAFCEGILRNWEQGDQPMQEHRRYLSTCPFVLGLEVGNIPLEMPSTALPLAVSETQRHVVGGSTIGSENVINAATLGILTERPRHERYAIENTRVQTFANWPPSRIPRPEELARAGFFYAGFGDNVKCFFCDGGLRNWEPQDDPWAEHARWFPRCGFVRQCKGDAFIQMIKERNSPHNPSQAQTQTPQGVPGSYHVEPRGIKARLETPTVQAVLDMGFSRDTVRQVIEKRLRNVGDDFPSAASLLDAVFNIEDEMNRQTVQGAAEMAVISQEEPGQQQLNTALSEAPPREAGQKTSQTQNTEKLSKKDKKKKKQDHPVPKDSNKKETKSLLEENKRLKEERTCKICMDEEVSVVFLPCGHLVACVQCAPALRNCAICRAPIKGTVRSFLS